MKNRDLIKRLAVIFILLCVGTGSAVADRGCEGDFYVKASYSERHTGEEKSAYLAGMSSYRQGTFPVPTIYLSAQLHKIREGYTKELFLQDLLSQHNKFRQSEMTELEILPEKVEQPLRFEVSTHIGEPVGLEEIRHIVKVEDFRHGCDIYPIAVSREQFDAVVHGVMQKVTTRRKFQDFYGEHAIYYDVEYEHEGRRVTVTLPSPTNPQGC